MIEIRIQYILMDKSEETEYKTIIESVKSFLAGEKFIATSYAESGEKNHISVKYDNRPVIIEPEPAPAPTDKLSKKSFFKKKQR